MMQYLGVISVLLSNPSLIHITPIKHWFMKMDRGGIPPHTPWPVLGTVSEVSGCLFTFSPGNSVSQYSDA